MSASEQKNSIFNFLTQPKFRVWRHVLFTTAFVSITLSQAFFAFENEVQVATSTIYWFGFCSASIIVAFVYLNIYYLVPRLLLKGKYIRYIIVFLMFTLGFILVEYYAKRQILLGVGYKQEINTVTLLDWLSNLTLYAICVASSSVAALSRQWVNDSRQIEDLENKRLKTDIDELKNRINPQLLFTTLDYTSEKVKTEPKQVSDMLFTLSELLRYQLYDCRRDKVLLTSDMASVDGYLSLKQKSSFGRFTYTISSEVAVNQLIPSGIFMPLVDKVLNLQPKELHIKIKSDDHFVKFSCSVSDGNLLACNLAQIEQRLKQVCNDNFIVSKRKEAISLQLNIC